jgi:FixJ family two-component response regulator
MATKWQRDRTFLARPFASKGWNSAGMARRTGLELKQRLSSDGHRIPIVILTAHGDDEVQPGVGRWRGRFLGQTV